MSKEYKYSINNYTDEKKNETSKNPIVKVKLNNN